MEAVGKVRMRGLTLTLFKIRPFSKSLTYDYLGRRVQKDVTEISTNTLLSSERFLYDSWNLIAKYSLQTSNFELQTSYTWGLDLSQTLYDAGGVGGLLSVEELSGAHQGVYHFSFDVNGNVTEVLDNSSNLAAHYEYDPFGNVTYSSGSYSNVNPYRFSTKYLDEETGLCYYGYRYYEPTFGRWLNRDPLQEVGGLNLYIVVYNSLTNFIDVLGLASTQVITVVPGVRVAVNNSTGNIVGVAADVTGPGQEINLGKATITENTSIGISVDGNGNIEVGSSNPINLDGPGPFNGEVSNITFDSDGNFLSSDAQGNLITPDSLVENALKKEVAEYADEIGKIDDFFDDLNEKINDFFDDSNEKNDDLPEGSCQ